MDVEMTNKNRIGARGEDAEELERRRRHKARIQRMKQEKERQLRIQRMVKILLPVGVLALAVLIGGIALAVHFVTAAGKADAGADGTELMMQERSFAGVVSDGDVSGGDVSGGDVSGNEAAGTSTHQILTPVVSTKKYTAQETASTTAPPGGVDSTNVIFLERDTGNILAQRDCHTVINPASMTKVMTLLVAAEHVTDLDDTFVITIDITDYSYSHDCSAVGFARDEEVTVRDLLYGTILPSGGDAAVGLATYVAGSHEAFVDMMNEKAEIMGLSDTTHFTNCVGLYDADHHCTVYDMAMIMRAALDNELCREVLSAHTYTTSSTAEHPEGITVSNWFLRRIEDKDTGGDVVCAKTGFVVQSGNCAVSYGVSAGGKEYICATTGAHSSWKCIYDHVALYKAYE